MTQRALALEPAQTSGFASLYVRQERGPMASIRSMHQRLLMLRKSPRQPYSSMACITI